MFDDEKDKELMRVQAQKDHRFLTKNISRIGVGLDKADTLKDYKFKHADPGSLLQVVKKNIEEEIQEGDHFYTVTKGSQTKVIETDYNKTLNKGDATVKIAKGKFTETIEQDHASTINKGDRKIDVKMGKKTQTIFGNYDTTVKTGNMKVDVKAGMISMSAPMKIELKCGASKITMTPAGVTIDAPMITLKGKGMIQAQAPMTQVKGDAMLVLKGGLTMIN